MRRRIGSTLDIPVSGHDSESASGDHQRRKLQLDQCGHALCRRIAGVQGETRRRQRAPTRGLDQAICRGGE